MIINVIFNVSAIDFLFDEQTFGVRRTNHRKFRLIRPDRLEIARNDNNTLLDE